MICSLICKSKASDFQLTSMFFIVEVCILQFSKKFQSHKRTPPCRPDRNMKNLLIITLITWLVIMGLERRGERESNANLRMGVGDQNLVQQLITFQLKRLSFFMINDNEIYLEVIQASLTCNHQTSTISRALIIGLVCSNSD